MEEKIIKLALTENDLKTIQFAINLITQDENNFYYSNLDRDIIELQSKVLNKYKQSYKILPDLWNYQNYAEGQYILNTNEKSLIKREVISIEEIDEKDALNEFAKICKEFKENIKTKTENWYSNNFLFFMKDLNKYYFEFKDMQRHARDILKLVKNLQKENCYNFYYEISGETLIK